MDEREHAGVLVGEETVILPPPSEEEQKERDRKASDKAILKAAHLYYLVFSEGDGAAVLEDLHASYMERGSVDPSKPDPFMTAFREGERAVVLKIIAMMKMGISSPD
jgi:hypothetical protein